MQLINFWDNVSDAVQRLFRDLLSFLSEADMERVRLYSVFPPQLPQTILDKSLIHVHYSGEPYEHQESMFDASITMGCPSQKTVTYPYFALVTELNNWWPEMVHPRPLDNLDRRKFCLFVVANGASPYRIEFFDRVCSTYKRVESCGKVRNNTGILAPHDMNEYREFIRGYKFMICFENSQSSPFYITEKLANAYVGGAIPIYWGANKLVREYLNPKAVLMLDDTTPEAMDTLIEQIKALDQDDDLYATMHAEPLIDPKKGIPEFMTIAGCREKLQAVLLSAQRTASA